MKNPLFIVFISLAQVLLAVWLKHCLETKHVFARAPEPIGFSDRTHPGSLTAPLKRMVFWLLLAGIAGVLSELAHRFVYPEPLQGIIWLVPGPTLLFTACTMWQALLLLGRLIGRLVSYCNRID